MKLVLVCLLSCCLTGCVSFGVSYTNPNVAGHDLTVALTKPSGKEPVGIFVNATKHATK